MEPSYAAVMAAIEACGFSATTELANYDASYLGHVSDMLRLQPLERVRRLSGERPAEHVLRLADAGVDGVLIGDVAGALCGWPLMFPSEGSLEVCADRRLARDLVDVEVVQRPAGTRGVADLRRDREWVALRNGLGVWIASPLDLLRVERARGHRVQAGALAAVLEHRRRWPDGPPAQRRYTEQEAAVAVETRLSRSA
jgi:hypothetical protein